MLLDDAPMATPERPVDLLALDEALSRLSEFSPRKGKVVEMRFFGGLTIDETAGVLGISTDIVKREWRTAKLWLLRSLSEKRGEEHPDESDGPVAVEPH